MNDTAKSNGHICFCGEVEFYQIGSEVFRARISQPIADIDNGTRIGRWECSRSHFDRYREHIAPYYGAHLAKTKRS